ncbi:unnamed protein product [Penicillium viridicatum]
MSSAFTSSTFSKASRHALSFCSTSSSSSPFGGSVHVDSHGFLKSSHRVGGPMICSLPTLTTGNIPSIVDGMSLRTESRTASILGEHGLEFIYVGLVGRISKVDPESEHILTMLIVMPDQPNPDKWYRACHHIQLELAKDTPGICVELIEEKLNRGIYCSPVDREHPIIRKWPSIVNFILSHADFREWTALECWRYGTDTERQLNPVTVIVQVRKTSTNPFITPARHLHEILACLRVSVKEWDEESMATFRLFVMKCHAATYDGKNCLHCNHLHKVCESVPEGLEGNRYELLSILS